jgi:Asp-tRNA(Asn)/Glu-tRNA(Gln) amidotransferase A subunit family amidase
MMTDPWSTNGAAERRRFRRTTLILPCALLGVAAGGIQSLTAQQERTFDLLTASVSDIQDAVSAGALTYERLVELYLARIEAYDRNGPKLNAVIEVNPKAREIARALDEERRRSGVRSPLHGIPVAVKDNLDVADLPSAGGNLAFGGTYPARDASVVRRLREAGAIVFLKTNMDDLALGSMGLGSLRGQILNPYDLTKNPGGSSGGTGVAVNVGFAAVGIATETGVSIRSPASNNALVGIAPTRGLVSRAGVLPISFTQDRVGAHGKSVADAALLLTYLTGFDPEDLSTRASLGQVAPQPYTEYLDDGALGGARIGVLRDLFRQGAEFQAGNQVVERELNLIKEQGAIIADGLSTGMDLVQMMPTLRVNDFELRFAFDAYLARRGPQSPVKSFEELAASGRFLSSLAPRFQETLRRERLDDDSVYVARLQTQESVRDALVALMDRERVDVLVYPFKSLTAPPIGTADSGPRDNAISSTTGLPAIVVPAGVGPDGLPLALELLGRPFSEPRLVALAHAYETASRRRVQPSSTPHLPGEVFTYRVR